MIRTAALALTVLTGVSGLVYQIAWQKVLASLLGSHSEATAAVLALFLGGLSVGYALFGRISRRRCPYSCRQVHRIHTVSRCRSINEYRSGTGHPRKCVALALILVRRRSGEPSNGKPALFGRHLKWRRS